MGFPVKLRSSQSAPNLFSDWNNLNEFAFLKIGEEEEEERSQKKRRKIANETHSNELNPIVREDDWVRRLNYFDREKSDIVD